jgi:hypothetical protein
LHNYLDGETGNQKSSVEILVFCFADNCMANKKQIQTH